MMRTKLFAARSPILLFLVLLLTVNLAPSPGLAEPGGGSDPTQIGQIGGVTKVTVLSGGQLYFNVGPRIVRMAVSSAAPGAPVKPEVYGRILPGIVEDIKVANGYVYVAMGAAGVAVVDASTLEPLSSQLLPGAAWATKLAAGSQALYVAAGRAGIVVYDLGANKKSLTYNQTKSFVNPAHNITDVEIQSVTVAGVTQESLFASANNYTLDLTLRGGVLKFDVTNSLFLDTPTKTKEQIEVNALALTDSMVYAAGQNALYVLDAQELGGAGGVSSELALAKPAWEISAGPSGKTVYLMNRVGIDVVDVSTPTAPVLKTSSPFATPTGFVVDLAAAEFTGNPNTFLYLADLNAGLSIAQAPQNAPQSLTLASLGYVKPKVAIVRAVAGAYRQAFVASDSSTLLTVDSASPASPSVVGAGLTPGTPINSMTTYNDKLLVSAGASGLLLYQINPGGQPTSLGSFMTGGNAYAAAMSWPNAVVAAGTHGLVVVNLDGTPTLTGWAPAPEFNSDLRRVDVQGNYAYAVDNNGTLRIYDLTDPTGPIARGTWRQAGVIDVKVSGKFAFLAGADSSSFDVTTLDITDPDAPVFVSGQDFSTLGMAQSLAVYKNYLFVADGVLGVQMLSIQPSGHLNLAATIATTGRATQLALVPGDNLYVADENGSLAIVQVPLFGPVEYRYYFPMIFR